MRKMIAVLLAALAVFVPGACRAASRGQAVDAAHNSRNSVDWPGVYTGTIPAADGPGINVKITLNENGTWEKWSEYIDRDSSFTESGNFTWDESGGVITLDLDGNAEPPYYRVGENILIQLDLEGNEITGSLADMYILRKTPEG